MAIDLDGPNSAINVNSVETYSGSTLTIGKSGDTVSLGSGASASGFTKDGAITWDSSIKTANTSITTGTGFFVDTTSAAITITLPSSPSVGNIVGIKDYAGTFGTNNLTIARNGSNIQGNANDSLISTDRASVVLVYADATRGWLYTVESNVSDLEGPVYVAATGGTVTTSGDFKIHTFTSSGTFTVTEAGNAGGSNSVDFLVVAGGAGGGRGNGGGGGGGAGAGGYRESFPNPATGGTPVSAQAYPITVGSGGSGSSTDGVRGSDGSSSTFSTTTSAGGGGGGASSSGQMSGGPGGSGGGGGINGAGGGAQPGGTGNTPSVSPPQGNPGGPAASPGSPWPGGSGGGAGAAGGSDAAGGAGTSSSISGSSVTRAGGGGKGFTSLGGAGNPAATSGGSGGGGDGGGPGSTGGAGTANTGGGAGGGGHPGNGGNGGSGIVIIRYKFQN